MKMLYAAQAENFVDALHVQAARDAATRMSLDIKNQGVFTLAVEGLNTLESYAALALMAVASLKVLAQQLRMDPFAVFAEALDVLEA